MSIHFINQLKYPDLPYFTQTEIGGLTEDKQNFAYAGCGVCCLIMAVEARKGLRITIDEGIKYAMDSGATKHYGTDLDVLLSYALPKYDMVFEVTNDINLLKKWVLNGGVAVANTGGDRDGYICPFSPRGHYVFVYGIKEDKCYIFDTSYRTEKYTKAIEEGNVIVLEDTSVVVTPEYLDKACDNKNPRYCLIK